MPSNRARAMLRLVPSQSSSHSSSFSPSLAMTAAPSLWAMPEQGLWTALGELSVVAHADVAEMEAVIDGVHRRCRHVVRYLVGVQRQDAAMRAIDAAVQSVDAVRNAAPEAAAMTREALFALADGLWRDAVPDVANSVGEA